MKYFFCVLIFGFGMSGQAQIMDLELFASEFSRPLDIANAGDDRLFVVERRGAIKIVDLEGNVFAEPFIDLDPVVFNSSNQDERGLLGMTFHPDYANNGYFFVNYIDNDGNTIIERYQVDASDPNKADDTSGELIIEIEQPVWNHNGGCLKFGSDGFLYIGMGDGGAGNDPDNYGQNRLSLLGKMLRIDVDNGLPYTIPEDNPFANDDFTLDEIWAIGMRNPWRFSFDQLTGDLWIGDVGQGALEEIDFQPVDSPGGENYGWRCYEGTAFTNISSMADCQENYVDPVFEVAHQGFSGPCSITGGYVYRGTQYSELVGKYVCADYCTGDFYIVEPDGNGGWQGNEVAQFPYAVSTFGEDVNGELYIASFSSGEIYHIVGENIVSTGEIAGLESVHIQPNPTTDNAVIRLNSNQKVDLKFQLLDITGKVMLTKTAKINGEHEELIEMQSYSPGTYILNISSGSNLLSKQIIVR
ncbi:MAG: PQQ-dependent sugar dehydrogenase [Bacteroidota bacterium]